MKARVETDERGRKRVEQPCTHPCAIERGMRIRGGKWTSSILWHLKDGPVRFNDLSRMVGGASQKMVAERLRQLEAQGLIERRVRAEGSVAVEYEISAFGRTALSALDELRVWSEGVPVALSAHISAR